MTHSKGMTNTATIDAPATTEQAERKLSRAHDRCDTCGAQAFVAVSVPVPAKAIDAELLFCGHHYRANEQAIAAGGYPVHDERHLINTKPSVSANAD